MNVKIRRVVYISNIGTDLSNGILISKMITRSQEDYIKKYLVKEMGQIVEHHQELSWILMTAGVEFLGRCIDTSNTDIHNWGKGYGEKVFKKAISELFPDKYKQFKSILYKELRCGFNHTTLSGFNIIFSEREYGQKHLSSKDGKLILVAEDFYEDFKKACKIVVDMLAKKQIQPKFHLRAI